jgi:hypothetical protein
MFCHTMIPAMRRRGYDRRRRASVEFRLLADAHQGDILLVEQVDRLSRLTAADWEALKAELSAKHIRVVALDLPTSWMMAAKVGDEFTGRMFEAINGMLLDMLAAVARKDYEDRRRRQAQGQAKAKRLCSRVVRGDRPSLVFAGGVYSADGGDPVHLSVHPLHLIGAGQGSFLRGSWLGVAA